jgi:hypothetical protein
MARFLISRGSDINSRDEIGFTPLYAAYDGDMLAPHGYCYTTTGLHTCANTSSRSLRELGTLSAAAVYTAVYLPGIRHSASA